MSCVSSVAVLVVSSVTAVFGVGATFMTTPVAALSHEEWVVALVRFIDWPNPTPETTLVVCQPPETPPLLLDGRQVRGLTIRVRRMVYLRELDSCDVFVAFASEEASWGAWLKRMTQVIDPIRDKIRPILTIGKGAQFCDLGGAICLVNSAATSVETYRLNLDALARRGFRVDSQLLRLPRALADAEPTTKAPAS